MTEQRLIQGSYGEQRYLHSDEVFRKERNWNINLPSEREFKNGYCIITDKENTAYSIDELVELLNEFQIENESLEDGATKYAELYHKSLKENKKLNDENIKLRWILRHYNPQDLNLDFDDEKFKEQIDLLYSEKEFLE